jgi:hypothetical protein
MMPSVILRLALLFFALGVLALGVALLLWRSVGAGGLHLHGRIATPRTTWRTPYVPSHVG